MEALSRKEKNARAMLAGGSYCHITDCILVAGVPFDVHTGEELPYEVYKTRWQEGIRRTLRSAQIEDAPHARLSTRRESRRWGSDD